MLLVALSFALAGQAEAGSPALISAVGGNYQFLRGSSYPIPYQPLVVRVVDIDGVPVPDSDVLFEISSSGAQISVSVERLTASTDANGIATLENLRAISIDGFFNVRAKDRSGSIPPATFLLSQWAGSRCFLPAPPISTRIVLAATQSSSSSSGSGFSLSAMATVAGAGNAPLFAGHVAIMDGDSVLSSKDLAFNDMGMASIEQVLAPGPHLLNARVLSSCDFDPSQPSTLAPSVATGVLPATNHTDLWWNESESGWGLSITQRPSGQLFLVLYHYFGNGAPRWLTIPGGVWLTPSVFSGVVYCTAGPRADRAFDPSIVTNRPVGIGTLAFDPSGTATFRFAVDNVTTVKRISRQPF